MVRFCTACDVVCVPVEDVIVAYHVRGEGRTMYSFPSTTNELFDEAVLISNSVLLGSL